MVIRVNELELLIWLTRLIWLICVFTSVETEGLLTIIVWLIPYKAEPDKLRVRFILNLLTFMLRRPHHVIENLILTGTSISLVT